MNEQGKLVVEVRGATLRVTINRPEKRNALSRSVLAELRETFEAYASSDDLKLAIITGAADKSFAAGGDLKDLSVLKTREEAVGMAEQTKEVLNTIRYFPLPVIAAINGDALGGGAELSVACDFRIAAAHARIGFVQGRLNISTAWGGGIDLFQLLGPSKALRLLGRSELLGAEAALELGLVDAAASNGKDLNEVVDEFAAGFLKQTPRVLRAFKAMSIGHRRNLGRDEMEDIETQAFAGTWVHDDHWQAAEKLLGGRRV